MFLWGFPLGAFAATWLYWPVVQRAGLAFPFYVLSVPFLFAMVVIRTATRGLHIWSVKVPMVHLALLWSTYSALGILIVGDTITAPFTVTTVATCIIVSALVGFAIGALIDIVAIDEGLLELHQRSLDLGTVTTVLSYSFQLFGTFGAVYGAVGKVGYWLLTEQGATRWLPVLVLCGTGTLCLPFMIYFQMLRKSVWTRSRAGRSLNPSASSGA